MKAKIVLFLLICLCGYAYWHYDTNSFVMPKKIEITQWAKARVNREIMQVTKPVPPADVKKAYVFLKSKTAVYFSIRSGKVDVSIHSDALRKNTYFKVMNYVIKQLAAKKHLKDNDFIVILQDRTEDILLPKELAHVPVFVFAKDLEQNTSAIRLLIVDSFTLKSWTNIYKDLKKCKKSLPWEKKKSKLFWRGKTTDAADIEEFRLNSPRANLTKLTKENPVRYDARLTKILSTEPLLLAKVKKQCGDVVPFASIKDHLGFKYQITLDGLTATFPGYLWRMASGCVNIKQDSTDVQWFYELFQPNVHYVPVKRDLSNIDDIVQYAQAHDADMKTMAMRAHIVVEQELTPSKVFGYLVELLNAYAAKLDFKN
ncbi:MAG: glycosyl transferase family 90 [Candidatus Paracaedibacteraceae bacterium]|nr:glycosyl transferase family 90 [Candidatus Paracaedibacteraceae bacterium]